MKNQAGKSQNGNSHGSKKAGRYFERRKRLKSTKQCLRKKKLAGFDIETCNNNRSFLCATIIRDDGQEFTFRRKQDLLKELKARRWRNYIIFATNLGFDYFGTFFGFNDESKFRLTFRGSDLLCARTYIDKGDFNIRPSKNGRYQLQFYDTMNYAKLSVKSLGKIVNIEKLDKPLFLGQRPQNDDEWSELLRYNKNDALISLKFAEFLQESLIQLGGDFKMTGASCALKLFKNKYLKDEYFIHSPEILSDMMKSYYGGRSEVITRGRNGNTLYYYDVNSMYPYVMSEKPYPDPNSLRVTNLGNIYNIMNYEGVSFIGVYVPKMKFPPLPVREKDKVIFRCGTFTGWYANSEIRYAISCGAQIFDIGKCYFYTKTCKPFTDFVQDLYKKRLKYRAEKNPMEYVTKIMMNSLYGKFAQRWDKNLEIKHEDNCDVKDFENSHEQLGKYVYIIKEREPYSFSIPVWSIYVTAYGRMMLHDLMVKHDCVYCDTDSIITPNKITDSSILLGGLKLEHTITESCFVRPKMYGFRTIDNQDVVRCKGINIYDINYQDFMRLLDDFRVKQTRFVKFKTALRMNLSPNMTILTMKIYQINDDKRKWSGKFKKNMSETSVPYHIGEKPKKIIVL